LTSGAVSFEVRPGDVEPPVSVIKASIDLPVIDNPSSELVFTRHRVERGETLSRISYKYGLSPSTLISINNLKSPEEIKNGKILIVPYIDGIRVSVSAGESPEDLADRFGTSPDKVQLIPGSSDYFISGDSSLEHLPASFTRDVFLYPVTGRILTGFGESMDTLTGIGYESEGLDLYAAEGSPVKASRGGRVILTGNHSAYGLYVMMSHAGGWKSFYGHLSRVDVAPGDELESGMVLGLAGRSGTARSPRLYFALIRDNQSVDPLDYLY
jgi:murein DD-endopeptidase MepM/ murein hydrolase activator NlpD